MELENLINCDAEQAEAAKIIAQIEQIGYKRWTPEGTAEYDRLQAKREGIFEQLADKIEASTSAEDIRKMWFIDWGTMNGWSSKHSFLYNVACKLHVRDIKRNPELHKPVPARRNWSCWHEDNCSCGMCSSYDSGD